MRIIFYILFVLSFLFINISPAQAKVYWVGRNIDMSPGGTDVKNHKMLKSMGHSYIIIVPDNPQKLKAENPLYNKLEINLGCGKKGVIIGAYPEKGKVKVLNDLDGSLGAKINATREYTPTKHFFCGTNREKSFWNFVSGVVSTNLSEETFINNLLVNTYTYIFYTKDNPVDYHAVRSTIDSMGYSNDFAQNCNAFAFSLLAWSGASKVPDLGAKRTMPGQRNLLSWKMFDSSGFTLKPTDDFQTVVNKIKVSCKWPVFIDSTKDYTPEVIKNDHEYRDRIKKQIELQRELIKISFEQQQFSYQIF